MINKQKLTHQIIVPLLPTLLLLVFTAHSVTAADYPIPDTGQAKCYDGGGIEITCPTSGQPLYGQDANYTINTMSYTKLDSNGNTLPDLATSWAMVRDNVTGLIWENKNGMDGTPDYTNHNDADNIYSWYDSNPATNGGNSGTSGDGNDTEDFIKALNDTKYGGYSDWRLPTMKELGSIVDYSIPTPVPTVNSEVFTNTISHFYWSSTTYANSSENAWGVNFSNGNDVYAVKTGTAAYAYVRAVRGGQASPSFVSNGDGIVTDSSTGLMWEQSTGDNGNMMIWTDAIAYCEKLTFGGHSDWRLPTIKELRSIVDYSSYSPAVNKGIFADSKPAFYWSSTTNLNNLSNVWGIYFSNGGGVSGIKGNVSYVRAVRGGDVSAISDNWVMSVKPDSQTVSKDSGAVSFSVSNTGTGTMNWTAVLNSGSDWLQITSGASGSNAGTISCSFDANESAKERIATIRITPEGSDVTPKDVKITQAAGGMAPTVSTNAAASITENSVTLKGSVNPNGLDTTCYFEYGTTTSYGKTTSTQNAGSATSSSTFTAELIELNADTTYHFRLVAKNSAGTINGNDQIFKTATKTVKPLSVNITASPSEGTVGIAGLEVAFNSEVSGGIPPYTYLWHLEGNITNDRQEAVHVYQAAGNYIVTLTITDTDGNTGSASVEIKISSAIRKITIEPADVYISALDQVVVPLVKGYYSDGLFRVEDAFILSSSDESVARIVNGQIVPVGQGSAVITASVGSFMASMTVHINLDPVALDVDTSLVTLAVGETHTPIVIMTYPDGSRKLADTFTIEIPPSDSESIVRVEGSQITALASGLATLKITYGNLSTYLMVDIAEAALPLNIRPSKVNVNPGTAVTISISGGKPPYNSETGEIQGMNWIIIAQDIPGETIYTIKDSLGQTAPLSMTVKSPLTLSRISSGVIKPGDTINFKATGGTPPYEWSVTSGVVTVDAGDTTQSYEEASWKVPAVVGSYTIIATDSSGQYSDYLITTYANLIASPSKIYLSPEEAKTFNVIGGKPPYSATTKAGVVTAISGNQKESEYKFSYKAPKVVGSYEITISDTLANKTSLYVQVSHPLWVSPQMSYMKRSEQKVFQLAGGIGKDEDLYVQALRGDIAKKPENRKFEYVAPEEIGQDIIMLTDIDGTQVKVIVEVTSDKFFVTPSRVALLPEETALFRSVRGTGDSFTWSADMGDIRGNSENTTNITYQAPEERSKGDITCMDIAGNKALAQVHVISDRVLITPKMVYLSPGERTRFRALLGTEEYEFTYTDGSITSLDGNVPDSTTKEIIYHAPKRIGEFFVTVFDSAGNEAQAKVVVSGGAVKPKISTTEAHLVNRPSATPDSATQPMGVGDVQNGGTTLDLAVDFPNYTGDDKKSVPMNYYLAVFMERANMWFFFKEGNEIGDILNMGPYMGGMTDSVYQSVLGGSLSLCNPNPVLPLDIYHIYALAVESGYDMDKNLNLNPADAPFEFWSFSFEFKGCPDMK